MYINFLVSVNGISLAPNEVSPNGHFIPGATAPPVRWDARNDCVRKTELFSRQDFPLFDDLWREHSTLSLHP
jgi:hypothetical protein